METYITLAAGLIGALIGSLTSIATLVIQAKYQQKNDFKKLVIQLAMEDFKFRIEKESDRIQPASAPVVLGYWDKMIDLISRGRLTPESIHEVLEYDAKMKTAVREAYDEWVEQHPKKQ